MPRGRPRKSTVQVTFRINFDYMEKLKLLNPQLMTRDTTTGKPKFRHGALGRYIERLIREDLEKRAENYEDISLEEDYIDLDALMSRKAPVDSDSDELEIE